MGDFLDSSLTTLSPTLAVGREKTVVGAIAIALLRPSALRLSAAMPQSRLLGKHRTSRLG